MPKDPFETRLEALFDEPPPLVDGPAFEAAVERRLARSARWRADLTAAAWISAVAGVLWALAVGFDTPAGAIVAAYAGSAAASAVDFGGGWFLPAVAVGAALLYLALEDQLARD